MEKIWVHTFSEELKVESENRKVLLTEAALNPKKHWEKTCEIFFETFGVGGFYLYT